MLNNREGSQRRIKLNEMKRTRLKLACANKIRERKRCQVCLYAVKVNYTLFAKVKSLKSFFQTVVRWHISVEFSRGWSSTSFKCMYTAMGRL